MQIICRAFFFHKRNYSDWKRNFRYYEKYNGNIAARFIDHSKADMFYLYCYM